MADPEFPTEFERDIEAALSPESVGHLLLLGIEKEVDPLSEHEQRCAQLLDIQARHSRELQESGVLWRAYLDATNFDIRRPDRPLLAEHLPYRACVYRLHGMRNKVETEVCGVRFTTTDVDDTGNYWDTAYDVPVYVNGQPRRGFGSLDIETISQQVNELQAVRKDLFLGFDLAHVIRPRA